MVLPAERALANALSPADAKTALVHGGDELGTDGAGHAGNGNNGIVLHVALSSLFEHAAGNKKAPDLFEAGLRFR
jgi:hypothetical protein